MSEYESIPPIRRRDGEASPASPALLEPAYEIVYEFDSALASRAYKRFLWHRSRRLILGLGGELTSKSREPPRKAS